jgi:hypothetical protein
MNIGINFFNEVVDVKESENLPPLQELISLSRKAI